MTALPDDPHQWGPADMLCFVAELLARHEVPYFVTGSMAAMFYGEQRTTRDVDVVVDLSHTGARALAEACTSPHWYLSKEAMMDAMAREGMFNAIHVPSGLKLDFVVVTPVGYHMSRFARAIPREIAPGTSVRIAAAEDVILMKLRYFKQGGSDKHLRDIGAMLRISPEAIDRAYLRRWAGELGVDVELEAVLTRADRSGVS
jgi:hypothetical protein